MKTKCEIALELEQKGWDVEITNGNLADRIHASTQFSKNNQGIRSWLSMEIYFHHSKKAKNLITKTVTYYLSDETNSTEGHDHWLDDLPTPKFAIKKLRELHE